MTRRIACVLTLVTLGATSPAGAVTGFTVTTHWSGENENRTFYGGFGELWRHEIANNVVTGHTMIYAGPARMVVLNYSGTHVAFIKEDGTIAVMSAEGGAETDLVQGHPQGCLDWPEGDWIYYNLGTWGQENSKYIYRVNAFTGEEQFVVELEATIWRFGIARDHRRASIRDTGLRHTIVAYDFENDNGLLRADRAVDVPSCGTAMDPEGGYFLDGMWDHSGFDIRRWDDLEIVKSFKHVDATAWGDRDSGEGHNRNGWAVNSQKWICAHVGWNLHFSSDSRGSNQVLYNWVDEQRIVVTDNVDLSYTYDSAGDFWVDHNADNTPPIVDAGDDQTVNLYSPILLNGIVHDDGLIRTPLTLAWSQLAGPGTALFGTPFAARTTVEFDQGGVYTLRLTASDGALTTSDEVDVTVTDQAYIVLTSPNGGEVWNVGDTHTIEWEAFGIDDVTIAYSADSGDTWERVAFTVDSSSPDWQAYPWVVPDTPSTQCLVSIAAYVDGQGKIVSAAPFEIRALDTDIEIVRPQGGEVFVGGTTESIQWTTTDTTAVALSYSIDDGDTWHPIEYVDSSSGDWGDYPWLVPDTPSNTCRVAVSELSSWFRKEVSAPFEIQAAPTPDAGVHTDATSTADSAGDEDGGSLRDGGASSGHDGGGSGGDQQVDGGCACCAAASGASRAGELAALLGIGFAILWRRRR